MVSIEHRLALQQGDCLTGYDVLSQTVNSLLGPTLCPIQLSHKGAGRPREEDICMPFAIRAAR